MIIRNNNKKTTKTAKYFELYLQISLIKDYKPAIFAKANTFN